MKDRFVKVMLVIIASLLFLNCNKSNTENISSNIKTAPPQVISEALINDAQKHCDKQKWECQGFKVDQYNEADLNDADIDNGVSKKGGAHVSFIARENLMQKWSSQGATFGYELKKNGDLSVRIVFLVMLN